MNNKYVVQFYSLIIQLLFTNNNQRNLNKRISYIYEIIYNYK